MITLPRWYHQFRAKVMGKYWLPCPECGTYFGGHESLFNKEEAGGHIATVWTEGSYEAICPDCTRRGIGCRSHAQRNRVHAQCPFLLGWPPPSVVDGSVER